MFEGSQQHEQTMVNLSKMISTNIIFVEIFTVDEITRDIGPLYKLVLNIPLPGPTKTIIYYTPSLLCAATHNSNIAATSIASVSDIASCRHRVTFSGPRRTMNPAAK